MASVCSSSLAAVVGSTPKSILKRKRAADDEDCDGDKERAESRSAAGERRAIRWAIPKKRIVELNCDAQIERPADQSHLAVDPTPTAYEIIELEPLSEVVCEYFTGVAPKREALQRNPKQAAAEKRRQLEAATTGVPRHVQMLSLAKVTPRQGLGRYGMPTIKPYAATPPSSSHRVSTPTIRRMGGAGGFRVSSMPAGSYQPMKSYSRKDYDLIERLSEANRELKQAYDDEEEDDDNEVPIIVSSHTQARANTAGGINYPPHASPKPRSTTLSPPATIQQQEQQQQQAPLHPAVLHVDGDAEVHSPRSDSSDDDGEDEALDDDESVTGDASFSVDSTVVVVHNGAEVAMDERTGETDTHTDTRLTPTPEANQSGPDEQMEPTSPLPLRTPRKDQLDLSPARHSPLLHAPKKKRSVGSPDSTHSPASASLSSVDAESPSRSSRLRSTIVRRNLLSAMDEAMEEEMNAAAAATATAAATSSAVVPPVESISTVQALLATIQRDAVAHANKQNGQTLQRATSPLLPSPQPAVSTVDIAPPAFSSVSRPVFTVSGRLDSNLLAMLNDLITRDGCSGMVVGAESRFDPSITHVLVDAHEGILLRTAKVLRSIPSGRFLLHPDYIRASHAAGRLLDEDRFEWKRYTTNLTPCLNKFHHTGVRPYDGWRVHIGRPATCEHLTHKEKESYQLAHDLIEAGGGHVITSIVSSAIESGVVGSDSVPVLSHVFLSTPHRDSSHLTQLHERVALKIVEQQRSLQREVRFADITYVVEWLVRGDIEDKQFDIAIDTQTPGTAMEVDHHHELHHQPSDTCATLPSAAAPSDLSLLAAPVECHTDVAGVLSLADIVAAAEAAASLTEDDATTTVADSADINACTAHDASAMVTPTKRRVPRELSGLTDTLLHTQPRSTMRCSPKTDAVAAPPTPAAPLARTPVKSAPLAAVSLSCTYCVMDGKTCDGHQPKCKRCRRLGTMCTYASPDADAAPPTTPIVADESPARSRKHDTVTTTTDDTHAAAHTPAPNTPNEVTLQDANAGSAQPSRKSTRIDARASRVTAPAFSRVRAPNGSYFQIESAAQQQEWESRKYTVGSVLSHRLVSGRSEYLVRWSLWPSEWDSWERLTEEDPNVKEFRTRQHK